MILTDSQHDALTELINIAFSRTAASLSQLTNHHVQLDLPQVAILPIGALFQHLSDLVSGEVATVHQVFTGPVAGDGLLLLDVKGASLLSDLLTNQEYGTGQLDASAREVLTEIGNILLNACLGMFGNLLKIHVTFSVPRLHLETLEAMLNSLVVQQEELRYALVTYTTFRLRGSTVKGHMVVALSVTSLERLIAAVEQWAASPGDRTLGNGLRS